MRFRNRRLRRLYERGETCSLNPANVPRIDRILEECADNLGISRDTTSQLVNGQCGISPAIAIALERSVWSNAKFWMRRQAYYDLTLECLKLETDTTDLYLQAVPQPDSFEQRRCSGGSRKACLLGEVGDL